MLIACVALPQALLAAALPSSSMPTERRAVTPANDPFYQPPSGFESQAAGTVLKERRIIASFFGLIPDPVDARQLLYRSTALDGSAIATVTTIFKPLFAKKDRVVIFNTAYDSSATKCNPSYQYQLGGSQDDLILQTEFLVMQAYLLSGYTVASSDYEGPEAAWTAGRLSGRGVLDSMRAVRNYSPKLGLVKNPMMVNVGYSGGALAAGWAASLQPSYAPELNVKAWIMGGTPVNLTSTLVKIDGTAAAGLSPGAIAGLLKPTAYGKQLGPVFDSIVTPYGRTVFNDGNTQCAPANVIKYAGLEFLSTKVQSLGPELVHHPVLAPILTANTMALNKDETPTAPVMMYHASDDELIPYDGPVKTGKTWCDNGATVRFSTYSAGGHGTTEVVALVEAILFTRDAFAGTLSTECQSFTRLDNKLNPLALGLTLEPILFALGNLLVQLAKMYQ